MSERFEGFNKGSVLTACSCGEPVTAKAGGDDGIGMVCSDAGLCSDWASCSCAEPVTHICGGLGKVHVARVEDPRRKS